MDETWEEVRQLFGPDDHPAAATHGRAIWPRQQTPSLPSPPDIEENMQVKDSVPNTQSGDTDKVTQCDLGVAHKQCSAARLASLQVEVISLAADSLGAFVTAVPLPVGQLNTKGDKDVFKTFRGARTKVGNNTVNQSVTMSIDPRTLMCLSCAAEHPLLQGNGKPVIILLSDQNFLPVWPGSEPDKCIAIIRVMNPTLMELLDLLYEVMDRKNLPDGSVVLAGAVSHLQGVGVSLYAREWTKFVAKLGGRWPNVRVGPLVPIWRDDCPGGVAREVSLFVVWLSKVYVDSFQGMIATWRILMPKMFERMVGQVALPGPEYLTVPLPASLGMLSPDKPFTFVISTSRPSSLTKLDQGSVGEVLAAMSEVLNRDFNIPVGTGSNPASALQAPDIQENVKRIVLVGASNLGRVAEALGGEGFEIVDLCSPGWMITPEGVRELVDRIRTMRPGSNTAIVLDLFGNSSFRATLFDGSTSLPIKGRGGHHLPGDVGVCGDEIFSKLVETCLPIFEATKDNPCLIIPPQPRYIYSPCCDAADHCTNMAAADHAATLLAAVMKLRGLLKRKLVTGGLGVFWVMDSCVYIGEEENQSFTEKLAGIKAVCAPDGVHWIKSGYNNLARNIVTTLIRLQNGLIGKPDSMTTTAGSLFSESRKTHFWRGICSPIGSKAQSHVPSWAKVTRGWSHRAPGPYDANFKKRR